MTGAPFRDWVKQTPVPALRFGDTVVLDNRPAPKVIGIRERIETAGLMPLKLPAYPPDFSQIELAFAKPRVILLVEAAHTIGDLRELSREPSDALLPPMPPLSRR